MKVSIYFSSAMLAGLFLFPACGVAPATVELPEPVEPEEQAAREPVWAEDFAASVRLAQREDRPILLHFTGSDWSPTCSRWRIQILDTTEFADYALANLVLIELDYPKHKEQVPEVVQQNQELQTIFEVEGFPTLILLQPDGSEIERMSGVLPERPRDFIEWMETRL